MVKPTKTLTAFGEDLDSLLKRAGSSSLREYADQCGVSYKYVSQLRTKPERRPGRLYADLLKPFARLGLLGVDEGHRLSIKHRGRPLSLAECKGLFPETSQGEILESFGNAVVPETQPAHGVQAADKTVELSLAGPMLRAPLFRRVFVGRQTELNELRSAFDSAVAREPYLVTVSGEPGIGKTSLCRQLNRYVTSCGGVTLVGHCREPGSLSLPYLAFVEALRSWVLDRKTSELVRELGAGAPDIARIIPEVTTRVGVRVRSGGDPVGDKYRLLQAVTDFLARIAELKPLLLVLEDLHGADLGTLEMLQHVARSLDLKRLLIVGTYRDVEIDRSHPLSGVLAELRRLPTFGHLLLRGLTSDEVARMLSGIVGRDAPAALATAVHERTEGNPLFVEEMARYLVEEGMIDAERGSKQPARGRTAEMKIPDGLRDVIGKRLSLLSDRCNRVLSVASVIGRDFDMGILEKVAGLPPAQVLQAVREATKVRVVEEQSQIGALRYRFAHAFFRQALYEEMMAPLRIRLHQRVARALEDVHRKHLQEHAAELADHFSRSTDPGDLAKSVSYSETAARGAADTYAYGDAARFLEQGVRIQRTLDPDDKAKICALLLDLCDNLLEVPDTESVYGSLAPEAFSLAEAIGDGPGAAKACRAAMFALWTEQGSRAYVTPRWGEWARRADRCARPGTVDRVLADWASGMTLSVEGDLRAARRLWARSYKLAAQLDDALVLSLTGIVRLISLSAPQHVAERLRVAEELWKKLRPELTVRTAFHLMAYVGDTFLAAGKRGRAEEVFSALGDIAANSGNARIGFDSASMDLVLSVIDGRLDESIRTGERILAQSQEAGLPSSGDYACCSLIRAYLYRSLPVQPVLPRIPPMLARSAELIVLSHSGPAEEAARALEGLLSFRQKQGNDAFAFYDVSILEASVLTGHKEAAGFALDRFSGKGMHTSGMYWPTCISRHLGGAAALLDRFDEARRHYQEAIKVCTEMRFRPELALTRLQLAELLLEQYPAEKNEAIEHLDFAVKESREMKMQPSLERALRHKEMLKP